MRKKSLEVQKSNLLGIDIGNTGLSMAQSNGNKADIAFEKYPENTMSEGRIIAPEVMSKMLKDMKSKFGFSEKKCAVILPENSSFFKKIKLPAVTVGQLELNLPYEFNDYVGDNAGQYNYDYAVEKMFYGPDGKPESMEILAAAGLKETIAQYDTIIKKAGLSLVLALPREMALINLFKLSEKMGFTLGECAIIDIGYNLTRIYIFNGTNIMASRILDIGGYDIDSAISAYYNVDLYLASIYRENDYQGILESDICKEVYGKIVLEIMKTMNFYRYENSESELIDVFFSGSGSEIDVLKEDILSAIRCFGHNISEIIPFKLNDEKMASRCLMSLAVSTQKGRY